MKKLILLLSLIIFSFQVKAIDFYTGSYSEALEKAEREDKLVLLYFTAKWCGPCQYISNYILTDQEVHYKVTKNYIALKLDVDIEANKVIYYKYNTGKELSIPKFFFINSKEEVIKKHDGSLKLNQFKEFIDLPEWSKPIAKSVSDSIAKSSIKSNLVKPWAFNKFMHNSKHNRWKLGVRIGLNYHTLKTNTPNFDFNSNRLGGNFGLFIDYESGHFLFQPGIFYDAKGATNKNPKEKLNLNYLVVPLRVSINTFKHKLAGCPQSVRLNLEPYFALAINGKYKTGVGSESISFGNSNEGFSRFDYGIKTGISLGLGSFEPSIGYEFGLNNLSNKSNEKIFNRGFYFNIALIFGK